MEKCRSCGGAQSPGRSPVLLEKPLRPPSAAVSTLQGRSLL